MRLSNLTVESFDISLALMMMPAYKSKRSVKYRCISWDFQEQKYVMLPTLVQSAQFFWFFLKVRVEMAF